MIGFAQTDADAIQKAGEIVENERTSSIDREAGIYTKRVSISAAI